MKKLLYVDDEEINLELFKINFNPEYDIYTSPSAIDALSILEKEDIDVIITDFKMPKMNGIEFINKIKSNSPEKVCMMLTGYAEDATVQSAVQSGNVFRCIIKPWLRGQVEQYIREAFKQVGQNK